MGLAVKAEEEEGRENVQRARWEWSKKTLHKVTWQKGEINQEKEYK